MSKRPKPIVLTVLDGWGYRAETKGNAIALARKPAYDELMKKFANTLIHTSGPFVGLPEGQMGNSEVGHMNMGAGRIVHMDITRIDLMIAQKQLQNVPLFRQAMERGRARQLHLMGLLSDGGVHSHIQHLFALLEMAKQEKVERVFVRCFMDGRDTPVPRAPSGCRGPSRSSAPPALRFARCRVREFFAAIAGRNRAHCEEACRGHP